VPRKQTHDEYVHALAAVRSDAIPIGQYVDSTTPIKHLYKPTGEEWLCSPANAKKGRRPKSAGYAASSQKRKIPTGVYLHRLKLVRDDVELIGPLKGMGEPTRHRYIPKDYDTWYPRPADVLKGCVPKKFMGAKIATALLLTETEYVERLALVNPNAKLIGKYKGMHEKVLHEFKGIDWYVAPVHALRGQWPREFRAERISEARKIPESVFLLRLAGKHPRIALVGGYDSISTPARFRDLDNGEEWTACPCDVLAAQGSRPTRYERVSASQRFSADEFQKQMKIKNPGVTPLEPYQGYRVPIWFHNTQLNVEYRQKPSNALRGYLPEEFKGKRISDSKRWSNEEYRRQLRGRRPDIIVLDPYEGNMVPILHQHVPSGRKWKVSPNNALMGSCPAEVRGSYSEGICRYFFEFLFGHEFPCKHWNSKEFPKLHGYELDGYCPDLSLAFEHHGTQHYEYIPGVFHDSQEAFDKQVERDIGRRNLCGKEGITLIEIPDLAYRLSGGRSGSLPVVVDTLLKKYILETLEELGWANTNEYWELKGPTYFDYCSRLDSSNKGYFWGNKWPQIKPSEFAKQQRRSRSG